MIVKIDTTNKFESTLNLGRPGQAKKMSLTLTKKQWMRLNLTPIIFLSSCSYGNPSFPYVFAPGKRMVLI